MPSHARGDFWLLLTCEHAGNRIPREYARLFRGAGRVLASHRGWDPGALDVARALARRLEAPLLAVTWSRLLVEANRAPTNPRIWSTFTAGLPRRERERILERYWRPHRRRVEQCVGEAVREGRRVVHVAVHSFTPEFDGDVRRADVGLLYDPGRAWETSLCRRWQAAVRGIDPALRVRRNYPYRGTADGLTTWLRRRFPARSYAGTEVELNQALLRTHRRAAVVDALAMSLEELLGRERDVAHRASTPTPLPDTQPPFGSGRRRTPLPGTRSSDRRHGD
jgi:predicted N-formylglutamate amidohydrolase